MYLLDLTLKWTNEKYLEWLDRNYRVTQQIQFIYILSKKKKQIVQGIYLFLNTHVRKKCDL